MKLADEWSDLRVHHLSNSVMLTQEASGFRDANVPGARDPSAAPRDDTSAWTMYSVQRHAEGVMVSGAKHLGSDRVRS
jgi:hypothetical protein